MGTVAASPSWAQTPPEGETSQVSFDPIPYPDMSGLEQAVKEQLNEAYGDLQGWLRQDQPPAGAVATSYARLGQLLHAYELYQAAEASYRNAARLAPENVYLQYYLGQIYQKSGRFEKAVEAYRRSLELEPGNLAARVHLGEVLKTQNRDDEAVAELRKALELDPENPAAKALLGEIALAQGEHQKAVDLLESVLAAVPGADRLHYPLGLAYRGLGERDKALEHLDRAGTVGVTVADPLIEGLQDLATGERVHLLRGRQAFGAGHYGEAASEFRKALEADPMSARVRVNLGSSLGQMGDVVGALEQYEAAIALDPANETAHFNAGVLEAGRDNLEKAAGHFRSALDSRYDDAESHHRLGLVLSRLGKSEEALDHLREASSLAPRNGSARLDEAVLLVDLERYAQAVERLEDAYRLIPDSGAIMYALARMLAGCPDKSLRDGARALGLAQRVFEARPTPEHATTVAQALAELGRCTEAAEWQAKALDAADGEVSAEWISRQRQVLARYEAGPPCG